MTHEQNARTATLIGQCMDILRGGCTNAGPTSLTPEKDPLTCEECVENFLAAVWCNLQNGMNDGLQEAIDKIKAAAMTAKFAEATDAK